MQRDQGPEKIDRTVERRKGIAVCLLGTRIADHEVGRDCGGFEVAFPNGRSSIYFFWAGNASRRSRPNMLTQEEALELAIQIACSEQDKFDKAM
jgi:hypothetical protein